MTRDAAGARPAGHRVSTSRAFCASRSSKASGREELPIEEPVSWWHFPALDFHAALAGVRGPTLGGDQIVQMCQPRQKRLLAAVWVVPAFHRE